MARQDIDARMSKSILAHYPLPNRSSFRPNRVRTEEDPQLDIGWDEGIFSDGRPYRAEAWAEDGATFLTFFLSAEGLESCDTAALRNYLETEGVLEFKRADAVHIGANKINDDDGVEIWSVTVVIGDEGGLLVEDRTHIKPHLRNAPVEDEDGPPGESAMTAVLRALHFAADRHRHQKRKGVEASPYVNHPIAVAELLSRFGMDDPVTVQAALLHDTLEDTETTVADLEAHFGPHVRDVVLEVTDDKRKSKEMRKELQVLRTRSSSDRARLIRLADKISNVTDLLERPPSDWDTDRRLEYLAWTERVVAGCRGVNPALESYYDELLRGAAAEVSNSGPVGIQTT
jgi:GTP diphosphokinase / guanosine-3',5'-bis(diphosphate) 3'-diphosphatase